MKQIQALLALVAALGVQAFAPSKNRLLSAPHTRSATALVLSSIPIQCTQWNLPDSLNNAVSTVASRLRNDEVMQWRIGASSFFSTLILGRGWIDPMLVQLWTHLTTSSSMPARIFRTDSYEWGLAVACFAVYIHLFGYADRVVRKSAEQGRTHPWRKYRLQDRFIADRHRRMHQRKVANGLVVAAEDEEMPEVKHSKWHWQAWVFEVPIYVLPLLIWDITSPRRHRRLAAFGAPTTMKILGDVAGGLFLYDLLFFCGHFLMHKIPLFYRFAHKKHHHSDEVRASDQVRLTLSEEVLDVGFSIIALNWLGAHPVARSLYNIIITFLLCELHSGFDFPWTPQNVVPFGLATGSRRHHYHHRFGQHYYQKFFFTVDRLFGFFQKDDGSLKGDSIKKDPYIPAAWKNS